MVDEECQAQGVGGVRVGGLVVSGSLAGVWAAGREPGAAATIDTGAGGGVVEDLVEAVDGLGADLLAQVRGDDGAGSVVLDLQHHRNRHPLQAAGHKEAHRHRTYVQYSHALHRPHDELTPDVY